jgi:hypothetical protein
MKKSPAVKLEERVKEQDKKIEELENLNRQLNENLRN